MSFILDALKKSESDRQRQSGPSLFEVKVAPPRRTLPIWAVAIAVLLGINIIVVSWMLLRRPAAQQQAPAGNAPAVAQPSGVPGGAPGPDVPSGRLPPEPARPSGPVNGTAPTVSAPMARAAAPAASAALAPAASSRQPPAAGAAAPPRNAEAGADSGAGQGTDESTGQPPADGNPSDYAPAVQPAAGTVSAGSSASDLPLYRQIASSAGLPELHLDLHVFAERPQNRFVMINMHRLGEGDSLPSGVRVNAIRPDGVVLSYHGTRFLLPRN